jgi:hypothetical protein
MHSIAGRAVAIAGLSATLVMAVWVSPGWAPQRNKPEKLSIDAVIWNSQSQGFLVEVSTLFGIAEAGESAEFTLETVLAISDAYGTLLDVLGPQVGPVSSRDGSTGDGAQFVSLLSQLVLWPASGAFVGTDVVVTALVVVRNPAGEAITTATDVRGVGIQ